MISGRQALAQLERAVAQARADEARLETAYRAAADRAARARAGRVEAFRELARLRLDALTREGVVGELRSVEARAMALLADRGGALDHLAERRRRAEAAVQAAEAERHARAAAVEEAEAAIGRLRDQVEAEAKAGPEWDRQRKRLEAAERTAAEARKKASLADADRERKRKRRPYEADPLFTYLWRKGFGTKEDRSGGLVRWLDRKVARLVGYDAARVNYQLLNELPGRLRDHAARMEREIEAERARLKAVERAALVAAGVERLEAALLEARQGLEAAERRLGEARSALAGLDREREQASAQGDVRYREAVELLAAADARQDLQVLYRRAQATATPEDDALIRRIDAAEREIGAAEQEMGALQRQMRELAGRRAAIERERDEFRRQGYDNPWGTFSNEAVLASVIGGVLGGLVQGSALRDALGGGYQRAPSPWDNDFGGAFPLPQDPGAGGPWGEPGGSDDFRTGGTF